MLGDNPKQDGDKTTPRSSPQDVAFKPHAGKKTTREALIEAQIVSLFQKGLPDAKFEQYDALLRNEALRKSDPVRWVNAMSDVLDISKPTDLTSTPPLETEKRYLAELLAKYIDNARVTSYQMHIASGVVPKHSQSTSADTMVASFKKLDSSFKALEADGANIPTQDPSKKQSVLPLTPQRSAQEAIPLSSAPKPAKASISGPDEKQQETSEPRPTSRRNP